MQAVWAHNHITYVETVDTVETVETVESVETVETAETVLTEDLKKYDSLHYAAIESN